MLADAWAWREAHPDGYAARGGDGTELRAEEPVAASAR
jgi:hypothetical protein